jgi:hypothetical protein
MRLEKYNALAQQAIDKALEAYNIEHALEIAQAKYQAD